MNKFIVGDFIEAICPRKYKGIVYKLDYSQKYGEKSPHVILFVSTWCSYPDGNCNDINPKNIKIVQVTKSLKRRAKYWIKKVHNKKWFDNLTYVEILNSIQFNANE